MASLLRAGQFYLGNTVYVGEGERRRLTQAQQRRERYTMQRQVKVGTHPAIFSQETYEKAMAARKERVTPGRLTTP